MILATQMFPGIFVVIPQFIVMSRIGLIDSQIGLVIVHQSVWKHSPCSMHRVKNVLAWVGLSRRMSA